MNPVEELLKQLHDIEGIDAVTRWPLAIGWWVVIGLGSILVVALGWLLVRTILFRRSWKHEALVKLTELEKKIDTPQQAEALILFSEYLRRIAMKRFARSACAGLVGDDWLAWLSSHDAKQFDWKEKGKFLLHAPYAPVVPHLHSEHIREAIQAAKEWVY